MPIARPPDEGDEVGGSARERAAIAHAPAPDGGAAGADPLLEGLCRLARAQGGREARRAAIALAEQVGQDAERLQPLLQALIERARELEQLRRLSGTDELTGIANRRSFQRALQRELARTERERQPLALLLLDVDGLKQVNDAFGHPEGDRALRAVAACAGRVVRHGDLLARIGGDEFAIVLPATDVEEARAVGQRIREQLRRSQLGPAAVGVSVGVAITRVDHGDEGRGLLAEADADLYRDKVVRRSLRPAG